MGLPLEELAAQESHRVAEELLGAARRGGSEADFRHEVARIIDEVSGRCGLVITSRDEFSVARGRVDSVYNRLILEYKRPGVLKPLDSSRANLEVINQVKSYILDVANRERLESHRLAAVALDGFHLIFVRRVGEGWMVDPPLPVAAASIERFLRLLFSLSSGAALVPDNLVQDFGPRTLRAQRAVRAFYAAARTTKNALVLSLFEQWKSFYGEAIDYRQWTESIEQKPEFKAFLRGMGLEVGGADVPRVFFALHTYYALLIKLVASLAVARFAGEHHAPLSEFTSSQGGNLRRKFAFLEQGGLFRQYGIRNFLEGDFFGWYTAAWDGAIEDAVSALVQRLAEYDVTSLEVAPENARDLLKKLYQYLLPREIRHDLGEYYTPDWLAERLIRQTLGRDLGSAERSVLDPACGSGTFLVILIREIKRLAIEMNMKPADTLRAILKNVMGFDLNPLAVVAARTNYLLALGDLLADREGDVEIPVYQCDSVLTPARGQGMFTSDVYTIKTAVHEFRLPAAFANRESMGALTNVLDECVEAEVSVATFEGRVSATPELSGCFACDSERLVSAMFAQLVDLHRRGLDGVWPRIIKNAFAPLFVERCDYLVGNPPWVNWEHLPDHYRRSTMPLWDHYGLFPKRDRGIETILGGAKYDLSMLMTYVSLDRYLKHNGRLAFLLPQNLFKSSGAGQGFRRFVLPSGRAFRPLVVEDMSELAPFEEAANRTAVAIFTEGQATRYPVSYQYWKKARRGAHSGISFDAPYSDITADKITFRRWFAVPVDAEDPTSPWITARLAALKALQNVLGKSSYLAREGANTGGANAVYWLEITGAHPGGLAMAANYTQGAKRRVDQKHAAFEPGLLYPLIRGRDIQRWRADPSLALLLVQDPSTRTGLSESVMEAQYPRSLAYLREFEAVLRSRKSRIVRNLMAKGPFYSMFGIGNYTFARFKVVWRELDSEVNACVVGEREVAGTVKPCVPDHTCVMIPLEFEEEAHFICAALNSAPARLAIRNFVVLHPDPHVMTKVAIPRFDRDCGLHRQLAEFSAEAHRASLAGDEARVTKCERNINAAAAGLWGLTTDQLKEIQLSLEEA